MLTHSRLLVVCRKEMNWALASEIKTGGKWSKIQPVVDVQDTRLNHLSSDLSDEHLRGGDDAASPFIAMAGLQ